jgi:hypothetical protein
LARLLAIAVLVAACQRDTGAGAGSADHRKADCAEVVTRIQQAVQSQIDQVGSAAKVMIDKMMPAMKIACVEDVWPDALVACVIASKPGDLKALETCNALMPKALQDKLQKRLMQYAPVSQQPLQQAP